ncbi:MAG: hypothetical protein IJ094_12900 [Bacilli bacterium]|nr:hypothetical protein [Bacilli bacterium]
MRNQCNIKNCKNKLFDKDNMCHNFKSLNAIPSIKSNGEPYFACLNYEPDKMEANNVR